jgi:hypothetical protein
MLWAYTAQFAGGWSASLSFEDPRGHNIYGVRERVVGGVGVFNIGIPDSGLANTAAGNLGFQVPDIVANIRYDAPWGFVGVSGALHQVAGGYYAGPAGPNCFPAGAGTGTTGCGHPGEEWGYALGFGAQWNVPWAPGSTAGFMFRWAHGATGYSLAGGTNLGFLQGNTVSAGVGADAIFAQPGLFGGAFATGGLQLVDSWSINAHYEHVWTPAWRTSIYGGYAEVLYPGGAKQVICGGTCARVGGTLDPDYSIWLIGSRTQWAPWGGQLNIGVDVVYASYQTAIPLIGAIPNPAIVGSQNLGGKFFGDTDNFMVMFRVQRNWFP